MIGSIVGTMQAPLMCPVAVAEFELAPDPGCEGTVAKHFPVDVLAVFRLRRPGRAGAAAVLTADQRGRDGAAGTAVAEDDADNAGDADDAELDEDGDDFAWVQAYSFVFAEGSPVAPSKRKYTHECVPSWQYVYLSDVYELIPVSCLLKPALLIPNPTQTSNMDKWQHGLPSTSERRSRINDDVRPHFHWYVDII